MSTGDVSGGARPAAAPSRSGRTTGRVLLVLLVVAVVLGAIAVVADIVVRSVAQQQIAAAIERELPDGVDGEVDVRIGGFSVIAQYLTGRMDEVELSAPELAVQGSPMAVRIVGRGVPTDLSQPVGHLDGAITIGQDSLNALVDAPEIGDVALGDGTIGYEGTAEVLGLSVDYSATATAEAAGEQVLLTPVDVTVGALGGSVDVSELVTQLLGDEPVAVCTAEHLPEGLRIERIEVAPGTATVRFAAERFVLDEASLATKGGCD